MINWPHEAHDEKAAAIDDNKVSRRKCTIFQVDIMPGACLKRNFPGVLQVSAVPFIFNVIR